MWSRVGPILVSSFHQHPVDHFPSYFFVISHSENVKTNVTGRDCGLRWNHPAVVSSIILERIEGRGDEFRTSGSHSRSRPVRQVVRSFPSGYRRTVSP